MENICADGGVFDASCRNVLTVVIPVNVTPRPVPGDVTRVTASPVKVVRQAGDFRRHGVPLDEGRLRQWRRIPPCHGASNLAGN